MYDQEQVDYIEDQLRSQIEHLENINAALRQEIKTQRKEIAALREERRKILNDDKGPNMIEWKE